MKTLEAREVSVDRGGRRLLSGVSFTLCAGEWLAVAGPNGAGKSTLLRALTGEWGHGGTVLLDGRSLPDYQPRERAALIGLMDQASFGQFAFTVEEVVSMGRYPYRRGIFHTGDEGGEQAIEAALRETGLLPLRHRSVLTLSGGEKQRCALAQALCQQPQVLLLDEPANHLDLNYQKELYEIIDSWRLAPGRAVITVLHDLSAARRFASKALLIAEGRPLAYGSAAEALSDACLQAAWQMDVAQWMREMGAYWQG